MSTYKEIRGLKVRDYTTNPDNPIEGQLWYNTTDNVARYRIPNKTAAWRSAASMNSARRDLTGAGIYTSALGFGGTTTPTYTESYNGSTWTEVADLNEGRVLLNGAGASNTAALAAGGYAPGPAAHTVNTENWNGSSWTEVANLNTGVYGSAMSGTNTACLCFGGNVALTMLQLKMNLGMVHLGQNLLI